MIQTVVVMMITPAHSGQLPLESAYRTDAPEIELMAFQPVVEAIENTTTKRFPQYPKEYRLKVVMRSPERPNPDVHAGKRQLSKLVIRMIRKECTKFSPMTPPNVPTFRVATAILALSLILVRHKA
jgi:hypothetical protein